MLLLSSRRRNPFSNDGVEGSPADGPACRSRSSRMLLQAPQTRGPTRDYLGFNPVEFLFIALLACFFSFSLIFEARQVAPLRVCSPRKTPKCAPTRVFDPFVFLNTHVRTRNLCK